MERIGRRPSRAILLVMVAVTCAVAPASDASPAQNARLGLAISNLNEAWRESNAYQSSGVMVVGVDPLGRAAQSGIVAGDVLVSVDGRTIREPSDLGYAERSLSPDQTVSLVLARDGGRSITTIKIAPVGAAPTVAVEPTAAPDLLQTVDPAADPAAPAALAETSAAALAETSAAADTATLPIASLTSVLEAEQTAGQKSVASDIAPSLTAAGTAGSTAKAGAAVSTPVALTAPAAIAGPVATTVIEPGASPATTATVDSGGTPTESPEPAPAELGVVGKSLTPDLASALGASGVEGILVLEVAAASPADRSGLRAGDIILKVGAQPVSDMGEFQRAVAASKTPVPISTLRLGKPNVELLSFDGPPPTPFPPPSQEQLLMELREEVRSLRREVQSLRKKLGK
jgi:S1-C subfamily serine protease